MQNVENNMDDMFRKAAQSYKPNAGDSGWNAVETKLSAQPVVSAEAGVISSRKKNKGLLLLLLLMPLATAISLVYYYADDMQKNKVSILKTTSPENTHQNKITINVLEKHTAKPAVKSHQQIIQQHTGTPLLKNLFYTYDKADDSNQMITIVPYIKDELFITTKISEEKIPGDDKKYLLFNNEINKNKNISNSTNKVAVIKSIAVRTPKRFYAGISAGPEYSQVKSQGFKKAGFNAGIITGYQVSKKVAVETGLQYKKKNYFSDGKYFEMNKMNASMPAGMKVLSLSGSSNFLEIPLNIKYNISHTNTAALFISAGISSAIILKENNNYLASVNNTQQNLKGLYKHISTSLASSANISIGYEHIVGKQASLRVQPYIQIPLKGTGVGNMQVMSSGINIAVTSPFR